jgi:ABC-type amino acid transport substrate-binding protein
MNSRIAIVIGVSLLLLSIVCGLLIWRAMTPKPPAAPGNAGLGGNSFEETGNQAAPTESASETAACDNVPAQTGVLKRIISRGYITIGVQEDAPPMNFIDEETEKREGFDFEMASLIAAQLGLMGPDKVKAKEVDLYEKLFCFLKQKEGNDYSIDMIMSGISPDKVDDIEWSIPYYEFGYALIAKKNSYISTLNDCRNLKIGFVKGDPVVEAYVKGELPNAELVPLEDVDFWMNAINLGTVDAVVYDYPYAVTEVKLINDQKKADGVSGHFLEIKRAYLENSDSKYSIGMPSGNADLKEKIDKAIETIVGGPQYVKLINKYFKSQDVKRIEIPTGSDVVVVERGDSLARIAIRELGDETRWPEIAQMNNVGNNYLIVPGQKLILPAGRKP